MKRLILISTPIVLGMILALPASAQTYSGTFTRPAGESGCPSGYSTSAPGMNSARTTNQCFPNRSDSPTVAYRGSSTGSCPSGFRPDNAGSKWCTSGPSLVYNPESEARGGNLRKPRNAVRCPVGWQSTETHSECWTKISNPPRARLSNGRPCGEGELSEWGVWCTSNFQQISYQDAENAGVADANLYYLITQGSLENGTYFSPAATPIMNAKKSGGAATPRGATAPPSTGTMTTAPRDTRTGTMNPQRRNLSSLNTCPSGWFQGMQGQRELPDPNMCYPGPGAAPMYSVASLNAPCSEGYFNSMSWCVGLPGTTAPAQSANQSIAQSSTNCPAPASGTAAQIGSQLGGLLGGRRGNSQAGAALGGLLGAAAGAAKPAGCP